MITRTHSRTWTCFALLVVAAVGSATAQTGPGPAPSIEQDLLVRLKAQPIGQGTLDSLAVPDEFLRRVADRIIRMDYQKRYRMVLRGDAAPSQPSVIAPSVAPASPTSKRTIFGIGGGAALLFLTALLARRRRRKDRG